MSLMVPTGSVAICECCNQTIVKTAPQQKERYQGIIQLLYGVSAKQLNTKSSVRRFAYARFHYWFLLTVEGCWSLTQTGKSTGHDHTSVLHGVRKFATDALGTEPAASIHVIRRTYWARLGLSKEEIDAKVAPAFN